MVPEILNQPSKKLIGIRTTLSLAHYTVADLWKKFMPRKKEITNTINNNLLAINIFPPTYFAQFNPTQLFEKWATIEVTDFDNIPAKMESYTLPQGIYAVFKYKGISSDNTIYTFIFENWLPNSKYDLDNRPHLEILGDKYKNNDPESEEEIWIPIKNKIQLP